MPNSGRQSENQGIKDKGESGNLSMGSFYSSTSKYAIHAAAILLMLSGATSAQAQPQAGQNQNEKQKSKKACCDKMKTAETTQAKAASESKQEKKEESKASESRKDVLEPSQFFGLASFGYASAKQCPEIMEKLFCYCGCDLTDSHTSLLDCFTSAHGVDCHICQEEAVLANKLQKEGVSITEIQKTIDEKYSNQYPFEQDTAAYKKYKSTRLYPSPKDSTGPSPTVKFGSEAAGPDLSDAPATSKPKLKPGKQAGKCCGGEHDKNKDEKSKQLKEKDKELAK